MSTFYWHDYETFGADPRWHRPSQFAGLRTDEQLNPIGEPLVIYCQPPVDQLPEPMACLITGITPQQAQQQGVTEPEFAALIHEQFAAANTCGVGYNSIRFDDEVTRHLLYRNFYDPYGREWQNGNSRWDLIDVVRLCYALRPQGIEWPRREDGAPSFRLEDLSEANGLIHDQAHDALSDVRATIALAQLIKDRQPRLFNWCLQLRNKQFARAQLDFTGLKPVLHASGKFRSERGGVAMVLPLCPHPSNSNGVIAYDLSAAPDALLTLSADEIADRVFTATADLPEGVERIGLKTIHINRAPVLSPVSTLRDVNTERIGLDSQACERHRDQIAANREGLTQKLRSVFDQPFPSDPGRQPEQMLYDGLIRRDDQALFPQLRSSVGDQFVAAAAALRDSRLKELARHYRYRYQTESLSTEEGREWKAHIRQQLSEPVGDFTRLEAYRHYLDELRAMPEHDNKTQILNELSNWADQLEMLIEQTNG